jgi:hypothetical protein
VAIVSSSAESFFPQVDVNAVLLVAERIDLKEPHSSTLRFVNLKKRISTFTADESRKWQRLTHLVDSINDQEKSFEDETFRVKVVPVADERAALAADPKTPRNWSKYLRAPLSYYRLFGDEA